MKDIENNFIYDLVDNIVHEEKEKLEVVNIEKSSFDEFLKNKSNEIDRKKEIDEAAENRINRLKNSGSCSLGESELFDIVVNEDIKDDLVKKNLYITNDDSPREIENKLYEFRKTEDYIKNDSDIIIKPPKENIGSLGNTKKEVTTKYTKPPTFIDGKTNVVYKEQKENNAGFFDNIVNRLDRLSLKLNKLIKK